jgi:hypothetical protein
VIDLPPGSRPWTECPSSFVRHDIFARGAFFLRAARCVASRRYAALAGPRCSRRGGVGGCTVPRRPLLLSIQRRVLRLCLGMAAAGATRSTSGLDHQDPQGSPSRPPRGLAGLRTLDGSLELSVDGETQDLLDPTCSEATAGDHPEEEQAAGEAVIARLAALFWARGGSSPSTAGVILTGTSVLAVLSGIYFAAAFAQGWEPRPGLMSVLPFSLVIVGMLLPSVTEATHPQTGTLSTLLRLAPQLAAQHVTKMRRGTTGVVVLTVATLLYELGSAAGVMVYGRDFGLDGRDPPLLQRGGGWPVSVGSAPAAGLNGQYPFAWEGRILLYVGYFGLVGAGGAWVVSFMVATWIAWNAVNEVATVVRGADVLDPNWEASVAQPLRNVAQELLPALSKQWGPPVASVALLSLSFMTLQVPSAMVDHTPLMIAAVGAGLITFVGILLPGAIVTSACQDVLCALNEMRVLPEHRPRKHDGGQSTRPELSPAPGLSTCMVGTDTAIRIKLLHDFWKAHNKGFGPGFVVLGQVASVGTIVRIGSGLGGTLTAAILFWTELYAFSASSTASGSASAGNGV